MQLWAILPLAADVVGESCSYGCVTTTTSTLPASLPTSWHIASGEESCDAACDTRGLECADEDLQNSARSQKLLKAAFRQAGINCSEFRRACGDREICNGSGAPFILWNGSEATWWCYNGDRAGWCDQVPPNSHQRLCACTWNETDSADNNFTTSNGTNVATSTTRFLKASTAATDFDKRSIEVAAAKSPDAGTSSLGQGILGFMTSNLQLMLLLGPMACCCMCIPLGAGIYVWGCRKRSMDDTHGFSSVHPEPIPSNDLPELNEDTDVRDLERLMDKLKVAPNGQEDELPKEPKLLQESAVLADVLRKVIDHAYIVAAKKAAALEDCKTKRDPNLGKTDPESCGNSPVKPEDGLKGIAGAEGSKAAAMHGKGGKTGRKGYTRGYGSHCPGHMGKPGSKGNKSGRKGYGGYGKGTPSAKAFDSDLLT